MPHLRWAVATVAQRKGIEDHKQLAALAELDPQTVLGVWGGRRTKGVESYSKMFEVETLRKLCVALDARPPGVFDWSDVPLMDWQRDKQDGPPFLVWRVRELAEKRGLTLVTFARGAQMFYARLEGSVPPPANRLWAGHYEAITLVTLYSVLHLLFPGRERQAAGDLFTITDA